MKILQKNTKKILKIISFLSLSLILKSEPLELKEEVIGKNRKKHIYNYEGKEVDLKKSSPKPQIPKTNLKFVPKDEEDENIILSNSFIDRNTTSLIDMLILKDNMFLCGFEFITIFNDKTRKINPFRLLVHYNKEINALNTNLILGVNIKRYPKESFRENNSLTNDSISSFLRHKIYKIEGGYSLLEKKIPYADDKLAEIRKEKLIEGNFNLDLEDVISTNSYFNMHYLNIESSTGHRVAHKIFFADLKLNYLNNFRIKSVNNMLDLNINLYTDRLIYEDSNETKNFLKFKINDKIKELFKNKIDFDLNLAAETGLFGTENDFGMLIGGKANIHLTSFLKTSLKAQYNSLNKNFREMLKEIKDPDILVPKDVKREQDIFIEISGKFEPEKYFSVLLGGSLHFTTNKRVFEEQTNIDGYPLKIINVDNNWQKLFIDGSFNYSIILLSARYEFKNTNLFFISAHNLKTKIELMLLDSLTVSLLNSVKSSFNTNKDHNINGRFLTSLKVNYDILDFLALSFKAYNIFNQKAYYKTNSPVEEGRITLDFKINF